MNKNLYKFVKIIVFWCIVLVHTNSNYELDVHFRGMTISTEKPTKPVNSRRYHKIIYDNGKYYQIFPFWGGRGRKFKSCHSDQKSVRMHNSCGFFLFVIVHIQHISGLFSFYNLFSTYKVHTTKGMYTIYERYVLNPWTNSGKAL